MPKLNDKQRLFVDEYLVDLNATQAAIRAGYSARTANEQGNRLLAHVSVKQMISERKQERSKAVQYDAAMVLSRHAEIDAMDVLDILSDDGSLLPIKEWPKVWRTTISGIEVVEMAGKSDDEKLAMLRKIKWPDKLKNLELLGKHTDVQAYSQQKEGDGTTTIYNQIVVADRSMIPPMPTVPRDRLVE